MPRDRASQMARNAPSRRHEIEDGLGGLPQQQKKRRQSNTSSSEASKKKQKSVRQPPKRNTNGRQSKKQTQPKGIIFYRYIEAHNSVI